MNEMRLALVSRGCLVKRFVGVEDSKGDVLMVRRDSDMIGGRFLSGKVEVRVFWLDWRGDWGVSIGWLVKEGLGLKEGF